MRLARRVVGGFHLVNVTAGQRRGIGLAGDARVHLEMYATASNAGERRPLEVTRRSAARPTTPPCDTAHVASAARPTGSPTKEHPAMALTLTTASRRQTPRTATSPSPPGPSTPPRSTASGDTEVRALDDVTVDFATARFTAIMGPSGSGKSTLMHTLAGLDTLTSGSVWIGDVELGSLNEKKLTQLRRDRIGFIFQAFNLIPTLTATENITLPMKLAGRKPDQAWFDNVVDTVGLRHASPPSVGALGWSAAARRRCACAREPAAHHLRRRAHRQPRLPYRRRDPLVHASGRARVRSDDRDGHARPGGRFVRRPRGVPRRRPHRRRARPTRLPIPSSTACARLGA